ARFEAFVSAGMASNIKPIYLEIMFQRYESGELDQIIK
ncbi:fructose-1,6-bisphosphate aldolase, partial [Francisella tularensis subsp. holarctica]|nr:fructose-1,6-bisphosphate aldolase [Francisella tularensis subsp. holarctica]